MEPVLRIITATPVGGHQLRLLFSDGVSKVVDVGAIIEAIGGPVFEPLKDEVFFARVAVDPVCGTVVWPNGADLSPDALYESVTEGV